MTRGFAGFPFGLVVLALAACRPAPPSPSGAATPTLSSYLAPEAGVDTAGVRLVPIQTPKGPFKVWTKRFGTNPRIKLLLLHGGPGATHEYFEALERYLGREGIEFVYYDQLGSASSDQPKDDSLWTATRATCSPRAWTLRW
jgi:proline iminopeptidase